MTENDYTYEEAAVKLRIAVPTLRRWVSKGRISCHRLGRLVRFTDEDLASAFVATPVSPREGESPQRRRGRHRRRGL